MGGKHLVFVYGTLRKGFGNHYLLEDSELVGQGHTARSFALYADVIPYAFKDEEICPIKGEVYRVDEESLRDLDALEGHPRWYKREKTEVILEGDGRREAWMYFFPHRQGRLIESGDYAREEGQG